MYQNCLMVTCLSRGYKTLEGNKDSNRKKMGNKRKVHIPDTIIKNDL